jgi:putrescine transport system substrate-binding protein
MPLPTFSMRSRASATPRIEALVTALARGPQRLSAVSAASMVTLTILTGCSGGTESGSPPSASEDKILYLANWAGYTGQHTVSDFERATGIHVVYDTYDSANTLEGIVLAGDCHYDVVATSTDFFSREIKAGAYRALDRAKLTNWGNLDPDVLRIAAHADPGNRHAVPYLHAINGFAYNVDMIRARMRNAPVDSLDMLFKPSVIRHFADCGVTFLDSPSDVLPLALKYLHLDPNSTRPEDYQAAVQLLLKVRPYLRAFDSLSFSSDLLNKELCIAMCWSSDAAATRAQAREAGVELNLAFTVPREGANVTYDALLIPAGALHPDAAHRFIDFILQPQVIAAITNEIHYGNNNRAANRYVDPQILNDPTIYPTRDIAGRLYEQAEANPATERIRTRAWTTLKSTD